MHGGMKLRPWEIDRLTLEDVALAMDEDLEKPRASRFSTMGQFPSAAAYVIWIRSLTPRQRLELARDGRVKSAS